MTVFRLTLFILFLFLQNFVKAQTNIDVQHYKFEIGLSDQSDTIKGKATVTIKFIEAANKFSLSLASPNKSGKGMIGYLVKENDQAITSTHDHDSLIMWLKKPAEKNETRTFEIFYQGIPADGLIISQNKYHDRTFFGDNWPNRAHNWIPCKDEPGDKASFEFIVTAPNEYKVVSNGKLIEEKDLSGNKKLTHWLEDVSLPSVVMVIGVARFAVKQYEDSPPNIPVSAWTYIQDSSTGFRNYSVAPAIIKFYSNYIAPYPYNKLANVQSKTIFGGMENATAIFYYEESAEQNKSVEDLLAHEIAHQWFGDMATEKTFPHLWLSEGFATYMTNIYLESRYGTDSMNKRLVKDRNDVIEFTKHFNRPVVDSISPFMGLLNANSYQKGGWILHMLRKQMGDTIFQNFIRSYYDRYKGKNADTRDLEKIAEEVSGRDWKQFFDQWLYTPGIPQLDIQWKYDEANKKISINVIQQQKQGAFQFPFQIKLGDDQNSQVATLNITKQNETFSFPVNSSVNSVYADPNTVLLFDGKIERLNP